jgi:hypothetical protein
VPGVPRLKPYQLVKKSRVYLNQFGRNVRTLQTDGSDGTSGNVI